LLTVLGKFKPAHEHLEAALRSDEGMASQSRLAVDQRRLALLQVRMGRWPEAEVLLEQSYQSSRDLSILESRLASQTVRAHLRRLRGQLEDAYDLALDAMEAARSSGFLRRQVQAQLCLAHVAFERGQSREALELLRGAESLYSRPAPESNLMLQINLLAGRVHDAAGEVPEAFDRLMRAHNLARETGNELERHVVDSFLGEHFRSRGEEEKAADLLTRAARELGTLGAKWDIARARFSLARLLADARMARTLEDRQREMKLARSNLFEASRLFELLGSVPRVEECRALEARLQPERPAATSE
jgi:tetratricopeptide (TPR) repeat protein